MSRMPQLRDDLAPRAGDRLSEEAIAAWRSSRLAASLSGDPDDMLVNAFEVRLEPGSVVQPCDLFHRVDDASVLVLGIVVSGLVRVYTTTSQGRQVTVRYVTDGDIFGLPVVLAPDILVEGLVLASQALTPCHILRLSPARLREIAARDVENMWGLFNELARSMVSGHHMLAENLFQPVRARVARHMLDLAERDGSRMVVSASQQDIADAIGSVREVVSRAVLWLRDQGLVRREGPVYVLDDPAGLHGVATRDL